MASLALFFFPKQTLCTLSQLCTGVFFCHYCAWQFQEEGKKKHSSSHTAIECGIFLVVVVVVGPWLMTQV